MPDLIDRALALEKMCGDCKTGYDGHCPHPFGMCQEYESILQVPTIEPEVLHGYWEPSEDGGYYCTHCGVECDTDEFHKALLNRFCGNCGAEMW